MFYSIGWALFDRNDPTRLIARCDEPRDCSAIISMNSTELQTSPASPPVLVEFKGKHILYYGCADMRISAAYAE